MAMQRATRDSPSRGSRRNDAAEDYGELGILDNDVPF